MGELSTELEHLELTENIFPNVKFYITGQAPEQVGDLLRNGGAERMNYFSDYVTHLICGLEPEDSDLTDATDLYEIPAVSCKWVLMCAKVKRMVDTKPYLQVKRLFSGITFCLRDKEDRNTLWAIITFHGGVAQLNLNATCQYLVTTNCSGSKYRQACENPSTIYVITPDWIVESVKNNEFADVQLFHPKLIAWPKPSVTAAITGFIQDNPVEREAANPVTTMQVQQQMIVDETNNSTQALLDKLKLRMPWNQQQQAVVTVADSFQPQQGQQVQVPLQQQPSFPTVASTTAPSHLYQPLQQQSQHALQPHNSVTPSVTSVPQLMQQNTGGGTTVAAGAASFNRILEQLQQSQQQRVIQQAPITSIPNVPMQQQQFLQQQQLRLRPPIAVGLQPPQQRLPITPQQLQQQQQMQMQRQQLQMQQQQQLRPLGQQMIQQPQHQRMQVPAQRPIHPLQQQTSVSPGGNLLAQQLDQGQQQIQYSSQQSPVVAEGPRYNMMSAQQQQQSQPSGPGVAPSYLQQPQQQFTPPQQQQQPPPFNANAINTGNNFNNAQQQQQQFVQQQQQQIRMIGLPPQQQFNQPLQQQQQQQQRQWQQIRLPVPGQQQQLPVQQVQQQRAWLPPPPPPPPPVSQQPTLSPVSAAVLQQQQLPPQQQRQLIHLDAQTHQQLQQMAPEQRALFVAKLQKQRHLMQLQQQRLIQQQQQQRGNGQPQQQPVVGPGHIVIRSTSTAGLQQQQQQHWIQQQNGSSPQQQQPAAVVTVQQQPELQLRQHHYRLQQMQAQREQTQLKLQQQQQQMAPLPQQVSDMQQPAVVGVSGVPSTQPLVVNPKTKTALANMLSNRLHGGTGQHLQHGVGGGDMAAAATVATEHHHHHLAAHPLLPVQQQQAVQQPSAASTLKLLTANHNAQLQNVAPPPPPPQHHPHAHMLVHGHPPQSQTTHLIHPQQQQPRNKQQQQQQVGGVVGSATVVGGRQPTAAAVQPAPVSGTSSTIQQSGQQASGRMAQVAGPGPFYGHNPNLKLPSELFLLGCIFVCVEIATDLDTSVADWRRRIERHGGELEAQYCARVTHVLCRSQRHGVVMQALRDFKRCVTAYWLADTLLKRKVEPPSAALHLPAATLDSQPGARHLVALSGFHGTDRERIKHMITLTGAQYTNYFSRHNSVLVAARPEGPKFAHARKWNTPTVSVHWLTDVLLGQCGPALAQLDHAKYQQWPTTLDQPSKSNIFAFDATLVPTLMQAWKMPINISQESYERVKRTSALQQQQQGASLPPPLIRPPKRPRLDNSSTTTASDSTLTTATTTATDNDYGNISNDSSGGDTCAYRILFSTCTNLQEMRAAVATLGGLCARSHRDATHLVMSYLSRTNKLLLAVARGLHVVSDRWIRDSLQAGKFLQDTANNYSLDPRDFNLEYKCDFAAVARTATPASRARLFTGRTFFLTPSIFPRRNVIVELIQAGGGTVERVRRTAAQIEAAHALAPNSYVVVTHAQDLHLVADLIGSAGGKGKGPGRVGGVHVTRGLVCNVELVLTAVLRQTFEVEPYAVKVM